MMSLMQGASDDQVALMGCLVALIGSAGLMYLSFFVGPASRKTRKSDGSERAVTQIPIRPAIERSRDRAA
jgi:hypothetical protein